MRREPAGMSFASRSYLRVRGVWTGVRSNPKLAAKRRTGESKPFDKDRDPLLLGDTLAGVAAQLGWSEQLAESRLIVDWPELVGPRLAEHAEVVGIRDGVLHVQCDSTAWATELRRLRAEVITKMIQKHPEAGVTEIRFIAPNAPSWKHGFRSVSGRGPRDTYG